MTKVLKGVETLPKISTGWVGCRALQTDDRQTDGWATAYTKQVWTRCMTLDWNGRALLTTLGPVRGSELVTGTSTMWKVNNRCYIFTTLKFKTNGQTNFTRPCCSCRLMVLSYSPGGANVPSHVGTLAPRGEYDWTVLPSAQPSCLLYTSPSPRD